MVKKRNSIVPPIPKEVKEKFLKEVLLTHDDIQESASEDKIFQHDAMLKWQLRAFIEYQRSPCTEHRTDLRFGVTHEICSRCRRIMWEALKG